MIGRKIIPTRASHQNLLSMIGRKIIPTRAPHLLLAKSILFTDKSSYKKMTCSKRSIRNVLAGISSKLCQDKGVQI